MFQKPRTADIAFKSAVNPINLASTSVPASKLALNRVLIRAQLY